MTWEPTAEDRQRIAADVARQLRNHPGPLPRQVTEDLLTALREITRNTKEGGTP